ncbi:MAG: tetratricopeptide repeat protein [Terracidiphilus sp.]|jgi:tetratricopeptide (TPR) repeat protein
MNFFHRIFGFKDAGAPPAVAPVGVEVQPSAVVDDAKSRFFEIPSCNHFGECARSRNGRFLLTWADEMVRGKYFLLCDNRIIAEGKMARPNDGKVADNGTFILNQWGPGSDLRGTFRAFNYLGEPIVAKKITANLFNNGLSPEGRYAAVQTCNAPGSTDDCVLLVYDLIQRAEIGRFVPRSGWADDYQFHEDGTIELGYRKLGYFRYALTGEFLDPNAWEEAQLTFGDYSMALITVERTLKQHQGKPSPELAGTLIRAIDRVAPQIVPEHAKTLAMAKKLRGTCLESIGHQEQALRCYQEALIIDPKAGVKRSIERLTKMSRV